MTIRVKHRACGESFVALQYDGKNGAAVQYFISPVRALTVSGGPGLLIAELDFPMWLCAGEWICKGPDGLDVWCDKYFREAFVASGVFDVIEELNPADLASPPDIQISFPPKVQS
jgi:hypothetical protein